MGDSWGQPRGPSAEMVWTAERIRLMDKVAVAVNNYKGSRTTNNEQKMHDAVDSYLKHKQGEHNE